MLADAFVAVLALLAFVIIALVMINKKDAEDDAYERGWLDGYNACKADQRIQDQKHVNRVKRAA